MMFAETNCCTKCDCGTDPSSAGSLEFGRHAMTHFSYHFSLLELLLTLCSLSLLGDIWPPGGTNVSFTY